MEGRRHDWALYVQSGIEAQLDDVGTVDGAQHYDHSDSGYNRIRTDDVPFQGFDLLKAAKNSNDDTAKVQVTVEWSY